jgi:hypothetical protein
MNDRFDLTAEVEPSGPVDHLLDRKLLELDADPTLRTPYGTCAIDVAQEAGHEDIAERLEIHAGGTDHH